MGTIFWSCTNIIIVDHHLSLVLIGFGKNSYSLYFVCFLIKFHWGQSQKQRKHHLELQRKRELRVVVGRTRIKLNKA